MSFLMVARGERGMIANPRRQDGRGGPPSTAQAGCPG